LIHKPTQAHLAVGVQPDGVGVQIWII
jgi:hypothetical protein